VNRAGSTPLVLRSAPAAKPCGPLGPEPSDMDQEEEEEEEEGGFTVSIWSRRRRQAGLRFGPSRAGDSDGMSGHRAWSGRAFGVGMSDPGRKTRRGGGSSSRGAVRGGGSSSRAECGMRGGRRKTRAAAGITAPRERGRNIAGGGVVRLVDALRPPLRISRDLMDRTKCFTSLNSSSQSLCIFVCQPVKYRL
jgi:hypothetical protein